jgi:coiled-coil domain-containing protein 55
MAIFYKNLMEDEELKHDAAVRAAAAGYSKSGKKETNEIQPEITREKKLADQARRINQQLGMEAIDVNDEGEVVDKRQLLKGGLNVLAKKPSAQVSRSEYEVEYEARRATERQNLRERESQARLRRAVEEQYAQTKKRVADEELQMEEEIRLRAKSKKTEGEVMGARERYLLRKKAVASEK